MGESVVMVVHTPWLTDLPGVATEYAEWATLNPKQARVLLRLCHHTDLPGVAWRYYYPPQPSEVAHRIRREREKRTQ
jgi:hypothetical protein